MVLLAAIAQRASAQVTPFGEQERRPGEVAKVVMGNVAIGGVSAALRAWVNKTNVPRAFLAGAAGGAVHVSGKMISMGNGTAAPISGMLVSSVGASMVGNAARGKDPFDELFVPIGPLRLRLTPRDTSHAKLSLCLYDVASLATFLTYKEVEVDWKRSARAGTMVFRTPYEIDNSGENPIGVTVANMFVMSTLYGDQEEIRRHEYVHVQQYLFFQEVWGRPIDDLLRRRFSLWRRMPKWLEPGLGDPFLSLVDYRLFRRPGPLRRSIEAEAETLSR